MLRLVIEIGAVITVILWLLGGAIFSIGLELATPYPPQSVQESFYYIAVFGIGIGTPFLVIWAMRVRALGKSDSGIAWLVLSATFMTTIIYGFLIEDVGPMSGDIIAVLAAPVALLALLTLVRYPYSKPQLIRRRRRPTRRAQKHPVV